jgi:hypothetical protein
MLALGLTGEARERVPRRVDLVSLGRRAGAAVRPPNRRETASSVARKRERDCSGCDRPEHDPAPRPAGQIANQRRQKQ